jgi:4a-hydroxytetrahydrobiopterin dehydratase
MALAQKQNTLSASEIRNCMQAIPQWTLRDRSIDREFTFKDFRQAINFTNRVAQVAEAADHHPDICISYNKVKLDLSTHTAGGLTQKDFELATKLNQLV